MISVPVAAGSAVGSKINQAVQTEEEEESSSEEEESEEEENHEVEEPENTHLPDLTVYDNRIPTPVTDTENEKPRCGFNYPVNKPVFYHHAKRNVYKVEHIPRWDALYVYGHKGRLVQVRGDSHKYLSEDATTEFLAQFEFINVTHKEFIENLEKMEFTFSS